MTGTAVGGTAVAVGADPVGVDPVGVGPVGLDPVGWAGADLLPLPVSSAYVCSYEKGWCRAGFASLKQIH